MLFSPYHQPPTTHQANFLSFLLLFRTTGRQGRTTYETARRVMENLDARVEERLTSARNSETRLETVLERSNQARRDREQDLREREIALREDAQADRRIQTQFLVKNKHRRAVK